MFPGKVLVYENKTAHKHTIHSLQVEDQHHCYNSFPVKDQQHANINKQHPVHHVAFDSLPGTVHNYSSPFPQEAINSLPGTLHQNSLQSTVQNYSSPFPQEAINSLPVTFHQNSLQSTVHQNANKVHLSTNFDQL